MQYVQAEKSSGYKMYDSGGGGPATATARIARSRGKRTAANLKKVKMYGIPPTEKVEDYFAEGSVHKKLIEEEQVMVHAHANMEYWDYADHQLKPKVGVLPTGHYYSTLVVLGQSGGVKGKNQDTVSVVFVCMMEPS